MALWDNLNKTYSAGVAPGIIEYHERKLLETMKPELVHGKDAQKRPLPANNGKRTNFRRTTPFAAITTPLTEGVTPDGQLIVQTGFSVMVKPYGGHIEITNELSMIHLDNMHKEKSQLLADQAALSVDTISRDAINAGLNVQYTDAKTTRAQLAATSVLKDSDIKKAVRTLKRANVKRFSDGFFHAIVHPDVIFDLTSAANSYWVDVAKYQDKSRIEKYELGTMFGVKFFESTNAKVFQPQTYLFSNVESLVATAKDVAKRMITVTSNMTEDHARALTGKLVDVAYTKAGTTTNTNMCVEKVIPNGTTADITFRWFPAAAVSDEWTTAQTLTILPQGAGASNVDVYSTLVYGQDAYGDIELGGNGKNIEIIIHPPGSSGSEDPYNQRGTMSWVVKGYATAILQDAFIVRIESGATA